MKTQTNSIALNSLNEKSSPQEMKARLDVQRGTYSAACLRNSEEYSSELFRMLVATL